jgi:putative NADPH-quinone reductase
MSRRILIIQGHPHAADDHWCHGLAAAYAQGAHGAGHELREVRVATLDFPVLRSAHDWETHPAPAGLRAAQESIVWADHVVIFFPLWLGDMPALLKAFLEQVARPGFAFRPRPGDPVGERLLAGRSARVVVTMGMPAMVYRFWFRAHSVRSLERNILGYVGFSPVDETLVGQAGALTDAARVTWLARMRRLGRVGS